MTVEEIKQFMVEHPGKWIQLGSGACVEPQTAIDILNGDTDKYIDILKRRAGLKC